MRRKSNFLTLAFLISLCAVLAYIGSSRARLIDPYEYIVETHYSRPFAEEIGVKKDGEQLFQFARLFRWKSGTERSEVCQHMGLPDYQVEFMGSWHYIWETSGARYDWDVDEEYSGNFLLMTFNYSDRLHGATVANNLPEGSAQFEGFDD